VLLSEYSIVIILWLYYSRCLVKWMCNCYLLVGI